MHLSPNVSANKYELMMYFQQGDIKESTGFDGASEGRLTVDTDDQHDKSASSWGDVSLPIPDDVQHRSDSREDGKDGNYTPGHTPRSMQPEACISCLISIKIYGRITCI